jgi:hypothetical protein
VLSRVRTRSSRTGMVWKISKDGNDEWRKNLTLAHGEPLVEEGGECKQVVMTERIKIERREKTHDEKLSVTIE